MPIRLLDDALIDQIAAGEVVERPASVVKELVENSLDAGATTLRVQLREGGKALIRIIDDGVGMDRQDAVMCLERHATSKIRTLDDLMHVRSLGFRGEAIPSVASVSRLEILTRRRDDEVGTRVKIEGGVLQGVSDAGCAAGTQLTVRSLFYNVPVRRAFLRTPPTELGHCVDAVLRQVLMRPQVDALVTHEGRDVLRAPAASDLAGRVRALLGRDADALRQVSFEDRGIAVAGLISPVGVHQSSGRSVHLYVNGRHVRDPVLRRALRQAYQGIVPRGRHPVVVLSLTVPDEAVDVNVHPNKTEVRFRSPRDVVEVLSGGLIEAIHRQTLSVSPPAPDEQPMQLPLRPHPDDDPGMPAQAPPPEPALPSWLAADVTPSQPAQAAAERSEPVAQPDAPSAQPDAPAMEPVPDTIAPVALLGGVVLLALRKGRLLLVDGPALRQRVALRSLVDGGDPQRLLVPRTVEPGQALAARLVAWAETLEKCGLSLSDFGPGTVVLKRVPGCLLAADWAQLSKTLASALPAVGVGELPSAAVEVLAAGDQRPFIDEAEALEALLSLPEPWPSEVARAVGVDEVRSWIR